MADGTTIGRVREIAKSDSSRRFLIVSAPGKRYSGEKKITDLLYEAHQCLMRTGALSAPFEKVKRRLKLIVGELCLDFAIKELLEETEREILKRKSRDFTVSRGEYLIAKLTAAYLEIPFVDASELFRFGKDGCLREESYALIRSRLSPLKGAVIPGFYGSDENGEIRTFSRGGSDISGAIVASALRADLYENWTDVSGFLVCDPRILPNPKKIDRLSFRELKELSRLGASVIHHDAVSPVREAGIPVAILNTFRPQDRGTTILPDQGYRPACPVTGIAGGTAFMLLSFSDPVAALERLYEEKLSYEFFSSDSTHAVMMMSEEAYERSSLREISAKKAALVAIVGQGLNSIDAPARILKAVFQAGVQILISGYVSAIKFLIGVKREDFERTIRAVYEEFYRNCFISLQKLPSLSDR